MTSPNLYFPLPVRKGKIKRIYFSDILYLEGVINYTLIHLTNGSVLVSTRTLLFHVTNSVDDSFVRIHRSFCVNKQFIKGFEPPLKPTYLFIGDLRLRVSRRKQKNLTELNTVYNHPNITTILP